MYKRHHAVGNTLPLRTICLRQHKTACRESPFPQNAWEVALKEKKKRGPSQRANSEKAECQTQNFSPMVGSKILIIFVIN